VPDAQQVIGDRSVSKSELISVRKSRWMIAEISISTDQSASVSILPINSLSVGDQKFNQFRIGRNNQWHCSPKRKAPKSSSTLAPAYDEQR